MVLMLFALRVGSVCRATPGNALLHGEQTASATKAGNEKSQTKQTIKNAPISRGVFWYCFGTSTDKVNAPKKIKPGS
jgi:hypothetical protein